MIKENEARSLVNYALHRRKFCGVLLFSLLSACEAKTMCSYLNISLFNYIDRPIFDVRMNETSFMGAAANGFYGANAVMVMQEITLGLQRVSWRLDGPEGMPGNGEVVTAKNCPVINKVAESVRWLALHIYPDNTVEIMLSDGSPDKLQTERGLKIIQNWEGRNNGR
jgi:hypothetical protein